MAISQRELIKIQNSLTRKILKPSSPKPKTKNTTLTPTTNQAKEIKMLANLCRCIYLDYNINTIYNTNIYINSAHFGNKTTILIKYPINLIQFLGQHDTKQS